MSLVALALAAGCAAASDSNGHTSDASTARSAPAVCGASTAAGDYCGDDGIDGGDPDTLYTCAAPGSAPTRVLACAHGCRVAPPGSNDSCALAVAPAGYNLPWLPDVAMRLTQDCDDSCCRDHVGNDAYAWDWANGSAFTVRAARGGTITHLKINSTTGCATTACVTDVNLIVVDHGDGTQATYMHLRGGSAQPGVRCGASVAAGQPLAIAGTTGWSTGVHLHFQISEAHATAPTCECGADGTQCATTFNPFPDTWVDASHQTLPIAFAEWPKASSCADRRETMPPASP